MDQALFKCFEFWTGGGYASFKCNADGTSIITPYSDSSCITPSGSPYTVTPTSCHQAGSSTQQYFTTSCYPPPASTLIGYYKISPCSDGNVSYFFPLGICILPPFPGFNASTLYHASRAGTAIELVNQYFEFSDCSDVGLKQTLLKLSDTCTGPYRFFKASLMGTTLPSLTADHRYIRIYPDRDCQANVRMVGQMLDGCAALTPSIVAKFKCQADGSSVVQFFGDPVKFFGGYSISCSQIPIGSPFTVLPSTCTAAEGFYFTTSCVPRNKDLAECSEKRLTTVSVKTNATTTIHMKSVIITEEKGWF